METRKRPAPSFERPATDAVAQISRIPIIDTILDVVCKTTGMGFAVVARVTKDEWIACSVRDEIDFGLKPGGCLEVATTICNEIRETHHAVVIDNVKESPGFVNHPTPAMYGFESYISMPIFLKTGEFFGTLCAIDPKPALLNNEKVVGMFRLFADLISFHLASLDALDKSEQEMVSLTRDLRNTREEVNQYQFISHHNLQEPLRKLRMFSSMLRDPSVREDANRFNDTLNKIAVASERITTLIMSVDDFHRGINAGENFETVDLNQAFSDVLVRIRLAIAEKDALISTHVFPVIRAFPLQMRQLFYQLLSNALKFTRAGVQPQINILCVMPREAAPFPFHDLHPPEGHFFIIVEDNGIGIADEYEEKIFSIFTKVLSNEDPVAHGIGLAQCRKIVHNHGGDISVVKKATPGAAFLITLPL